jgi:hypothetical protein
MARPRNRIPSYLPHKPSGQARVRISGRDVYLGPFGSPESKEAYARLIAEHFANGESETIILPDGEILTVAALVVKYDDHAQRYYVKNGRPTDERHAIKSAVAPLLRLNGSTPAEEFGPKRLKAVRQEFVSSGRGGIGPGQRVSIAQSRGWSAKGTSHECPGVQAGQAGSRGTHPASFAASVGTGRRDDPVAVVHGNATRRSHDHASVRY